MSWLALNGWPLLAIAANPPKAESSTLLAAQLKYPRVRMAMKNKQEIINQKLKALALTPKDLRLVLVIYKAEGILEIHAKSKAKNRKKYQLLAQYDICAFSGDLGPKRQENDEQAPEGFYHAEALNPHSNFHLAIKVSYPNKLDRLLTPPGKNPGSMIMIHGDCVSAGCLAMTDEQIEEIYLLTLLAMDSGQKNIPIYIFPFHLTAENLAYYLGENSKTLVAGSKNNPYAAQRKFWENLKIGYDLWEKQGEELQYSIDAQKGVYRFSSPKP